MSALGWIVYVLGMVTTAVWVCERQQIWWRQTLAVVLWPLTTLLLLAIVIHLMVSDIRYWRAK